MYLKKNISPVYVALLSCVCVYAAGFDYCGQGIIFQILCRNNKRKKRESVIFLVAFHVISCPSLSLAICKERYPAACCRPLSTRHPNNPPYPHNNHLIQQRDREETRMWSRTLELNFELLQTPLWNTQSSILLQSVSEGI